MKSINEKPYSKFEHPLLQLLLRFMAEMVPWSNRAYKKQACTRQFPEHSASTWRPCSWRRRCYAVLPLVVLCPVAPWSYFMNLQVHSGWSCSKWTVRQISREVHRRRSKLPHHGDHSVWVLQSGTTGRRVSIVDPYCPLCYTPLYIPWKLYKGVKAKGLEWGNFL